MTRFERILVWSGGALFVLALAFAVYRFTMTWSIPAPADGPAGTTPDVRPVAIAIDTFLFTLFAAHHSLFARTRVKSMVRAWVPDRLLRSFYVWIASVLLIVTLWLWVPAGGTLYKVDGTLAWLFTGAQLAGL